MAYSANFSFNHISVFFTILEVHYKCKQITIAGSYNGFPSLPIPATWGRVTFLFAIFLECFPLNTYLGQIFYDFSFFYSSSNWCLLTSLSSLMPSMSCITAEKWRQRREWSTAWKGSSLCCQCLHSHKDSSLDGGLSLEVTSFFTKIGIIFKFFISTFKLLGHIWKEILSVKLAQSSEMHQSSY